MSDSINVNNDLKTVTRYALGYTPQEQEYSADTSSFVWTVGTEKAIRGFNTLRPYWETRKSVWEAQKDLENGLKGATNKETIRNYKRAMEIQNAQRRLQELEIKEIEKSNLTPDQKRTAIDFKKSKYYDNLKYEIDNTKNLSPKEYAQKIKDLEQQIADRNLRVVEQNIANQTQTTTKKGKLWNGVKKYSGYNKASQKTAEWLTKSSKLRKIAKFGRANALTAVGFDLAFSAPEIIQTKQELGTGKALKQTGRTLAIAGTQVAAYAVGAKAGAAMGAAIGSIIPGAGTLVGSILGAAIGLTASYFAGKGAQKLFGKSELDKAHDQLANEVAKEAAENPEVLAQVLTVANDRYSQEPEQSETTDIVMTAFNNVVEAAEKDELKPAQASQTEPAAETKPTTKTEKSSAEKQDTDSTAKNTTTTQTSSEKEVDDADLQETIEKLDYIINYYENASSNCYSGSFNTNNIFTMPYNQFNMPFMQGYGFNAGWGMYA